MRARTAMLMKWTRQPVRRQVTQGGHYDYVWASYLTHLCEMIELHPSTVSRHSRGVTLPPWRVVEYYAGQGTRCPKRLEDDLRGYIALHYRSRPAEVGLRAALMQTLAELPEEDAEDIRAYWCEDDLANMWAVLQWYSICEDYAAKCWTD